MIFFGRGGGALALDDGACGLLLFQKGAISQQQIKHLRFIHIIHQVCMLIEISKIQFIGTQEVESFNKPCGHCCPPPTPLAQT